MEDDERFKEIVNDPRFRTLRRKERKVKIDKRFKIMFNENRFNLKYSVDKRGRHLAFQNIDHLKRVYDFSSDEDEEKTEIKSDSDEDKNNKTNQFFTNKNLTSKYTDLRGENIADKSSSSDEISSEEEEEKEKDANQNDHNWGELDKDAPRADSISSRLAVCNIDWDRIKASDLFILFSTFNSDVGSIRSVKIYPSQFGKERMKEEEHKGPKELVEVTLKDEEEDPFAKSNEADNEVINSENSFISEKLREYQIKRLKYYYAVIECVNQETALHLYQELDGLEYESSASTLDIRFIPDEITFDDEEPSSECYNMPSLLDYEPPTFVTTALQQSKVKLTWDETNPERNVKLRKAFKIRDEAIDDLRAYLASDEEEDEEINAEDNIINETTLDKNENDIQRLSKYKHLLKSLEEIKEKEKPEFEMEVTWEPNLEELENDKELVDETDEKIFEKKKLTKKKAKKVFEKDSKLFKNDKNEDNKNELYLLTFENEGDKKHFDYDDFVENNVKKKKKKKKNKVLQNEDNFKFDPEDARFSAIYSSHLYNIEQSNSHFKRTKAIQELLDRKIKKSRVNN